MSSFIERVPVEVLEEIFLSSYNSNLALASKHLLAALSSPSLPLRMTVAIFRSRSPAAQTDLLRRRFFTLVVCDEASKLIEPSLLVQCHRTWPHECYSKTVNLEAGVQLSQRLVYGFGPDEYQAKAYGNPPVHPKFYRMPYPHTDKYAVWKLRLISRLFIKCPYQKTSLSLSAVNDTLLPHAQQGLHELTVAGNLHAAALFMGLRFCTNDDCNCEANYTSNDHLWVRPLEQSFVHAIVKPRWLYLDLVWNLGNAMLGLEKQFHPTLEAWCRQQQKRDTEARQWERCTWEGMWVGAWLEGLCYNILHGRWTDDYDNMCIRGTLASELPEEGAWPRNLLLTREEQLARDEELASLLRD
ncbi:MAG: hypothetical protein M1829_001997 [Trizodia sp. TS-e1964]|nr:MAG: hypothetical protein M1829_001997 [Trizodia sp. TS-e1964]